MKENIMTSKRRILVTAITTIAMLALSACGGGTAGNHPAEGPTGDPVRGGVARVVQNSEPRSLDPALLANSWANSPVVGNALYGTLMTNDLATDNVEYRMAEDFSSPDGGKTFTLKLRPGLKFSDGSPFNADAVRYNWERVKNPATGSPDITQAALIESATVLDEHTLRITLVREVPRFANAVLQTGLNWIGSPANLAGGQQAIDANPIGAGPFTLEKWSRQDVISLVRNPNYYDAPKPYLDRLEVRAITDKDQRYNTVVSGGADLVMEGHWGNLARADQDGLQHKELNPSGGIGLMLNTRRAPFDDPRARKALAAAVDVDIINDGVYEGKAKLPDQLFESNSPFYQDIPLLKRDPELAQKLFDELAAEGKPVSLTVSAFQGDNTVLGESIQTQLRAFRNVKVEVKTVDLAQYPSIMRQHDFDAITSSVVLTDPEPRLWFAFYGTSNGNVSGINDAELNTALDLGRTSQAQDQRVAAYKTVQQRLAELVPVIMYSRAPVALMATDKVGGIQQYGMGSVPADTLWIQK